MLKSKKVKDKYKGKLKDITFDAKIFTVLSDSDPNDFVMKEFLEEIKSYEGVRDFSFSIEFSDRKNPYEMQKKLIDIFNCEIELVFERKRKYGIICNTKITKEEFPAIYKKLKKFCRNNSCALIGFTVL